MKPSLKAGGTIPPCSAVKASGAYGMVVCGTQGEKFIGISPEYQKGAPGLTGSDTAVAYTSGDYGTYYGPNEQHVLATAGDTFSAAAYLMTTSAGKLITATTGNWAGARAEEAATAADTKVQVTVLGDQGFYVP
jgi:hypothetical protein